jgi:hypothetical protein
MTDKEKLIKEYEKEFEDLKKELGFEVSMEELEEEFYIKDYILEIDYIRENLSMQIASRIIDYYRNWSNYLNNILIPNPGFIPHQTEAKLFSSDKDRKQVWEMLELCMKYSSQYSLMFLSKDKKMQKEFIDNSFKDWKNILRPFLKESMSKVYEAWRKK